jgi:putative transposase
MMHQRWTYRAPATTPAPPFGLEPAYQADGVGRLKERSDGAGIERSDASALDITMLAATTPAPPFGLEPAYKADGVGRLKERSDGTGNERSGGVPLRIALHEIPTAACTPDALIPIACACGRPNHGGMSDYRRAQIPGGCFFFTVVTRHREPWLADTAAIHRLRQAFRKTMNTYPFVIDAVVILPDHLHAIWRLPAGDSNFSTRWRVIKHHVSTAPGQDWHWQPRFWEHVLRDENDWRRHVEYIHYNPVKHGYAKTPWDWPHSSFRRAVELGWHAGDWGATPPRDLPAEAWE